MHALLLFFLLLLNFGISAWDAFAAGVIWRDTKITGGFMRLVAWSAVIMSLCGFTMVLAFLLGMVAYAGHWINRAGFEALLSLTYLLIIVPILGAGMIITVHSWIIAWRERSFGSIATAGYNTFAMASDIYEAADGGISSAFDSVSKFFKSSDDDEDGVAQIAVLLILIVALALAGGLTYAFWRAGCGARRPLPSAVAGTRRAAGA